MIDFHTHIIHHIDDGAKTIEESVKMLEEAYINGTDTVVLTSHYYPKDNEHLNTYISRRNRKYQELKDACIGKEVPRLLLGAEVNVRDKFYSLEKLPELCIEGTDYMLVEMPFVKWNENVIEDLYNLTLRGVKLIIAHIDRYMKFPEKELCLLDELSPVYQVNSEIMCSYFGKKRLLKLLNANRVHVLGSDMHGINRRVNTLHKAYNKLEKHLGVDFINRLNINGQAVLENKSIDYR